MNTDSNNKPMNEHQWAQYIAQRKSGAQQGPFDQLAAAPEQVYDLEVDSSLRGLAQISNDAEFVNNVMEKVSESSSALSANGQVRKSLPTIAPSFERCFDHDVPAVPGLAVAAIGAYFFIASQRSGQRQTVESQDSPAPKTFFARVGSSGDETASKDLVSDLSEQSPKNIFDHVSSDAASSLPEPVVAIEEAPEENWASVDQPSGSPTEMELKNITRRRTAPLLASDDQPVEHDISEAGDLPVVLNPPAKDDRIIQSDKTWDLVLSCDDEGVCALTINDSLLSDDGLLIQSKGLIRGIGNETAKRLAFLQPQIGKQIGGSVTVGKNRYNFESPAEIEQTVEDAIAQFDVEPLKAQLAVARVAALNRKNRARRAVDEANKPIVQAYLQAVAARAAAISAGRPIPRELADLRLPNSNNLDFLMFSSQQQARHRKIKESLFADLRYSPSTDELLVFEKAVIQTETFLRGLAKENLRWRKQANRGRVDKEEVALHAQSQEALANGNSINNADFKKFVNLGSELSPPTEKADFNTKSLIQHLSGMELKAELHANARVFDLFADVSAFRSAITFVNTNLKSRRLSSKRRATELFEPLEEILSDRPDLKGLPLVMGDECRLSEEDAKIQSNVSKVMGRVLAMFDTFGNRNLGNDTSARRMTVGAAVDTCSRDSGEENSSQNFVTLDQMMQIDHAPLALDVIENLREANTDTAIELLAKRAKFDLRPEIRFSATLALKEFPKEKYRNVLLEGFEYPWDVVAQHSAEALVRLDDTEAVPELVELLKEHKSLTSIEEDGKLFQKEVVAVNHLRNCLLCHAPSLSRQDPSRGQVPDWERPLSRQYYQSSTGAFVRADVTYLTQDFSVVQPVKDHGPWPASQRIDYMVYKTPVSQKEAQKNDEMDQNKVHREAIVFALQSLTRKTTEDNSWESWSRIADSAVCQLASPCRQYAVFYRCRADCASLCN